MIGILSTRTICCKVALDNAADAALRETQQAFNCATTYCASVAWEQGVTNKNKLHQAGALHQEIAECLNITRATVSRYLKATGFPERAPYPRLESKLDPYHTYLSERWAAGEINGRQLWQELQEQGYTGSVMSVMRWAARQQLLSPPDPSSRRGRNQQVRQAQSGQAIAPLRTRRVAWWLLRRPEALSAERQALLARMEQANPAFGELYRLTMQFTEMLRKRQPEQLRPWLSAAEASDLRERKTRSGTAASRAQDGELAG